jgi:1,3-beta-glucanosyltransferase GAS1
MHRATRFAAALVAAATLATGVNAIAKITRQGRYLYDDSGTRFFIKGVAYQPQGQCLYMLCSSALANSLF